MPLIIIGLILGVLVMSIVFMAMFVVVCEFVDVGWVNKKRKARIQFETNKCPSCGNEWKDRI